jgi:glutamate-1-semialdehyde aminotransferase
MPPTPFTPQQQAYLARFADEYTRRMPSSFARREHAYPALADARSSQGWSAQMPAVAREAWAQTRRLRFPIVANRGEGAQVWDIDGNAYLDFCLGFGVHLFGHRPDFVEDALRGQLARGLPIGFQSDRAQDVAAAVAAMTGAERVAFCNTGAEAIMGAIRLARAATRRDTIAVFAHAYHGSYDAALPSIDMTRGLPASLGADTLVLEYGAPASLEIIEARAGTLAAVLVEPVQARSPALQPRAFLAELRALTRRRDVALIFDDILLGFRIHQGGSQAHFGVQADLATFGKILGGGLPIGVITGAARFLDAIDGGPWHAGGDRLPGADKVWFAGTFTKNPLTMAAAAAITTRLAAAGTELQAGLGERTARLVEHLSAWLAAQAIPLRIEHCGAMFRLMVTPQTWVILPHLRLHGVYAFDGATFFLSTAHTDADLARLAEALQASVLAMRDGGFFA